MSNIIDTRGIPFMDAPKEQIVISKKSWDRLPDKVKFRGKASLAVLQMFRWWTDKPQMFWRACIVQ
jgi:hypothetical protein